MPFLVVFMNEGHLYHQSYTKRMIGKTPNLGGVISTNLYEKSHSIIPGLFTSTPGTQSLHGIEGDHMLIEYNPKHLCLSKKIVNKCHYKEEMILGLEKRKQQRDLNTLLSPITTSPQSGVESGNESGSNLQSPIHSVSPITTQKSKTSIVTLAAPSPIKVQTSSMLNLLDHDEFSRVCERIETIKLYPLHNDLVHIFYQTFVGKWAILELNTLHFMFPKLTDIYVRDTTFNMQECNNLIEFLAEHGKVTKINRIFFSIKRPCAKHEVAKVKPKLNDHDWDFSVIEQVAFRKEKLELMEKYIEQKEDETAKYID